MENLRKATSKDDTNEISAAIEELNQAAHKIAEQVYKANGGGAGDQESPETEKDDSSQKQDDVVDADFEEKDQEDKKDGE